MTHQVSLLPYLESSNGFKLEPEAFAAGSGLSKRTSYPFPVFGCNAGLASLSGARLVSDRGQEVVKTLLLQQSDTYGAQNDPLFRLDNKTIDQCWQQAFSFLKASNPKKYSPAPIFLKAQIDSQCRLLPFQSLFFCSFKKIYFHPPCPVCGAPLRLCRDEGVLTKSGLLPYETSLKRYLYCAACVAAGFFVHRADASDPPDLKDLSGLIRDFARLIEKQNQTPGFPCPQCAENKACYGAELGAAARIVPYSFYPFHLFIFRDDSMDAARFLTLLSGSGRNPIDDQSADRATPGWRDGKTVPSSDAPVYSSLYAPGTNQYFLELLYLKLTFLSELSAILLSIDRPVSFAAFPRSLSQVRVKIPEQSGGLPAFWNFRLQVLNLGEDEFPVNDLPKAPPPNTLYFLANAWFYVLLANDVQSFDQVQSGLRLLLPGLDTPRELALFKMDNMGKNKLFAPENIYQDPSGRSVDPGSRPLWEKALQLGRSLLIAGLNRETEWSNQSFLLDLASLRKNIKQKLLKNDPAPLEIDQNAADPAIVEILSAILKRWESAGSVLTGSRAGLSPGGASPDRIPRSLEELSDPKSAPDKIKQAPSFTPHEENEYIRETTVLSPVRQHPPEKRQDAASEFISETVIIQSSAKRSTFAAMRKNEAQKEFLRKNNPKP